MNSLSIATIIAVLGFGIAPSFAYEDHINDSVHGRSSFALESALRDRGVAASGVEQWGNLIRASIAHADGTTTVQFFDSATLQPVPMSRG